MKRCAASILVMVLIVSGVFEFQSRTVSAQQVSLSFDGISDPAWGSVSDVSYSPDGRKIAVATDTGVYIYDEYLQPEAHLNAHVGQVYSAEWRGDGSRLATGGEDATLRIWDMIETSPTYLEAMQVIEDDGPVYGVSWSPNINANIVATRTVTRREQSSASIMIWADIKIWNLMNEQVERVIGNLASGSNDIVWHLDGSQIASAGAYNVSGHRLWVWDIRTGDLIAISDRHIDQITGISWKPDSSVIAFSDRTGIVDLFDVSQGRSINEVWSDHGGVSAVDWDPTGHYVAVASYFGAFLIYDANTGLTVSKIDTDSSSVSDLEWANTGHEVAVVLDYDTVRIYDVSNLPENTDVPTITPITPFPTDTLAATPTPTVPTVPAATTTTTTLLHEIQLGVTLYDAEWSPDGSLLAVATESGIRIFTSSLQFVTELQGHLSAVTAVAWSPYGTQLASGASYFDDGLRIWNYDAVTNTFTLDRVLLREGELEDSYETRALAWSPDGFQFADLSLSGYDGHYNVLSIYNASTWVKSTALPYVDQHLVPQMAWSPDGSRIALTGGNRELYKLIVVDVETLTLVYRQLLRNYGDIEISNPVLVSWNGQDEIVVPDGTEISVFEGATGIRISRLRTQLGMAGEGAWSYDGNYLYLADGGDLTIWDVHTQARIAKFDTLGDYLAAIDWSVEDKVVVASPEGILQVIDVGQLPDLSGTATVTPIPTETPNWTLTPTPRVFRSTATTPTATPTPTIQAATAYQDYGPASTPMMARTATPTPHVMPEATTYTIRAATATPTPTRATLLHEIKSDPYAYDTAWSPDSELLAVGYEAGVNIYTPSLTFVASLQPSPARTRSMTWHPDGNMLALANHNLISIWSRDQNNHFSLVQTLSQADDAIHMSLAWSPDGSKLASQSYPDLEDSTGSQLSIHVWDTSNWTLVQTFNVAQYMGADPVFTLNWSHDSTALLHVGTDVIRYEVGIQFSDPTTGSSLAFVATTERPTSFSLGSNGLLAIGEPVSYGIYDTLNSEWNFGFYGAGIGYIGFLQWKPDNSQILLSNGGNIEIRPASSDQVLTTLSTAGYGLDWSPNGAYVSALGFDPVNYQSTLQVWDVSELTSNPSIPTATAYQDYIPASTPTVARTATPTLYVMPEATTYTIRAATATPTLTPATPLREIQLEGEITAVEWNADGSLLAVASGENIEIFDPSLQPVTQFKAHIGQVTTLTWNPDGTQLATGGREESAIKIWDYDAQRNIFNLSRTITTRYSDIVALAWSPDGGKIAEIGAMREFHSQDLVNEVNIRDTSTWLLEFDESVYAFNSMPKIFWNVESTEFAFLEHQGSLWSLSVINALTLSGTSKASGYSVIDSLTWRQNKLTIGAVGEIYSRNSQDWTPLSSYKGFLAYGLEYSPLADKLAIASGYGISILDVATQALVANFPVELPLHKFLRWHPDNNTLASASIYGSVRIWDVSDLIDPTGTPTITPIQSPTPHVTPTYTPMPTGANTTAPVVTSPPVSFEEVIKAPLHHLTLDTELFDTKFSPDGERIAVAAGNAIKLYNLNLKLVTEAAGHRGNVTALDWSLDGSQLASAGGIDDGTIRIWNYSRTTETFTPVTTIRTDYRRIINIDWSPDGSRLAAIGALDIPTAEEASGVQVWDVATGQLISRSGDAFIDAARDLSWSSDGRSVIGGGRTTCLIERNPCPGRFGGVFMVDAATGIMTNNIELNFSPSAALNSRHDQIVIVDFMLLINSATTGEVLNYWDDMTVFRAKWNAGGNKLAIETSGETRDTFAISVFDTTVGAAIGSFQLPAALWSIDWSQNGDFIVTGTYDDTVALWDVRDLIDSTGTPTITPIQSPMPHVTPTSTRR